MSGFKVYDECCANCLLSGDRIVSGRRTKEVIEKCAREQSHFICHKASMRGEDVCCRAFYDRLGHLSQLVRIAGRLGMIEFVPQPDAPRLPAHHELAEENRR